jgi:hypothetical protein
VFQKEKLGKKKGKKTYGKGNIGEEERGTLTSRMESIPRPENSFPPGLYYVF